RIAVAEAQLHNVDKLLDDRCRIDRATEEGAGREAAAAGLVARERRLVDEQNGKALPREVVAGCRPCRPAPDHEHVEALHGSEATMRPALPGVGPSGQRERAVNPSAHPTEDRILPPPLPTHSLRHEP